MTSKPDSAVPSAVIDRVTLVLDAFQGSDRLSLSQVVRRTGLPRSSVHRMLERLVLLRWLRREGRDYELGLRMVELGSAAVHQDRLHRAAIPFLHELHRATGLVVHLAVLDGSDVVYLEKIVGAFGALVPSRVGGRQPAHRTAVGKALLAVPDSADSGHFDTELSPGNGRAFNQMRRQLVAQLNTVRARGIAYERDEMIPGFGSVAAPIGETTDPVAAVSVCGPMERMAFDHRLAGPVRTTALSIWRNLENGGATSVQPILQQSRPLRGRFAGIKSDAAVCTTQYAAV